MKIGHGVLIGLACVTVSSCGKGSQPSGQVVATVDGKEITSSDLNAELGGFTSPDPKVRKAAQSAALQQIVVRKALAQAAEKQKIDKTPEFAQQSQRERENLLVSTWQNRLVRSVPAPSPEEAQKYIAEHPELYSNRKIMTVDQIRAGRPPDAALVEKLKPLTSLEEIAAVLSAEKIPFQRGTPLLDTMMADDRIVAAIEKLPPGEVFMVPANGGLLINKVRDARVEPASADAALKNATMRLKAQRANDSVKRAFGGAFQQAKASIKYAKGYEPPAPPSGPQAAAPKPAAK